MADLVILPAIYMGLIIGIYEAILLHRDVSVPKHRFGHMMHALIFAMIAVFAAMNVEFVLALIPAIATIPYLGEPIVFRIAIALIAIIKIHAISAAAPGIAGGSVGMKEKWSHSFIIGALIVAAHYIWPFIEPRVGFLPGI